ncbi:MAG: hypothetical protein K6F86_02490 [Lachnospiraceae bacterium]|nr:hypothetical protein [Lachnospiraceae bacterium]
MEEKELYKELGVLTKGKNKWKENIPYVSSLLDHQSVKIQAKALWLLAEMGLEYTVLVKDAIPVHSLGAIKATGTPSIGNGSTDTVVC